VYLDSHQTTPSDGSIVKFLLNFNYLRQIDNFNFDYFSAHQLLCFVLLLLKVM